MSLPSSVSKNKKSKNQQGISVDLSRLGGVTSQKTKLFKLYIDGERRYIVKLGKQVL
jgi:hypothetical protein